MKTLATKEKQSAPAVRKARPYVHHPMGPMQLAQQVEVRRILRSTDVQAKLTIGQPSDKYEQEADRVADQVMCMSDADVAQRQPEGEEEEEAVQAKLLSDQITPLVQRQEEPPGEEEEIQTKAKPGDKPALTPSLESRINNLKDGGQPLDPLTRSFFERRIGYDFSLVRVHTDAQAVRLARAVGAQAYTVGSHIVFGDNRYAPNSAKGRRLLAHELTHVVQQLPHAQNVGNFVASLTTVAQPMIQLTPEDDIRDQLVRNFRRNDAIGLADRWQKLRDAFNSGPRAEARNLYGRLTASRGSRGELAKLFHGRIARGTRQQMLRILRRRFLPVALSSAPTGITGPAVGGAASSPAAALASILTIQGGALQHSGHVTARPVFAINDVVIESPRVAFNAVVSLRPGVRLGPATTIDVGSTQTLLGAVRTGVYRRGRSGRGQIVAERNIRVGQVRDAEAGVPAPWYWRPQQLTNTTRRTTVRFADQPNVQIQQRVGAGRLAETWGSDRFVTSLTARRQNTTVHLNSVSWRVPWNVRISHRWTGTGSAVTNTPSGTGPPTLTGLIAAASERDWLSFPNVASARTTSATVLMENLVPARSNDTTAWRNTVNALRRNNPIFTTIITADQVASSIGSDTFRIRLQGHNQVTQGPFSLRAQQSATFTVPLLNVLDPARIANNTQLEFEMLGAGRAGSRFLYQYPFSTPGRPVGWRPGNGGRYLMTGHLR